VAQRAPVFSLPGLSTHRLVHPLHRRRRRDLPAHRIGQTPKRRRLASPTQEGGAATVARHTPTPASSPSPAAQAPRRNDLDHLARKFSSGCSLARLHQLSRDLGLSIESLRKLDAGWAHGEPMFTRSGRWMNVHAWSFPMYDVDRVATGIRMRTLDGAKYAFNGGGGGLFIPRDLSGGGRVFLCEGPTDTAALLDLGFNVFGRESCNAGVELVARMLRKWRFDELVIFSQRDEAHERVKGKPEYGHFYPAQDGAAALAPIARLYVPSVRIIMPPADVGKDVRDWLHAGATADDVESLVAAAPSRQLRIASQFANKHDNENSTSMEGVGL
jgi:hypothetical protein